MRDMQARLVDGATVVAKDVDIDLSRAPTLTGGPAKLLLEALNRVQQRARLQHRLRLEHLVQEWWLVLYADRRRLVDAGGAYQRDTRPWQCLARGPQVSGAIAHITSQ